MMLALRGLRSTQGTEEGPVVALGLPDTRSVVSWGREACVDTRWHRVEEASYDIRRMPAITGFDLCTNY